MNKNEKELVVKCFGEAVVQVRESAGMTMEELSANRNQHEAALEHRERHRDRRGLRIVRNLQDRKGYGAKTERTDGHPRGAQKKSESE